jgi:hypothetical protein
MVSHSEVKLTKKARKNHQEKREKRERERERERKHVYTSQFTRSRLTKHARARETRAQHIYTINNILINEPKWGDINIRGVVHETFDVDGEVS